MKRILTAIAFVALGSLVFGQSVDIDDIEPSQIDFSEVDLSEAEFFFEGPVVLYASGIEYLDRSYAALLRYDGESTVTIAAPSVATTAGKPQRIDLKNIDIQLTENGLELSRLGIDGRAYTGLLVVQPDNDLEIASIERGEILEESVPGLLRDIERLETTIEDQNQRIARLNRQIEELPEEGTVTELREQTRELEDQLEASRTRVGELETTVGNQSDRIEDLEQNVSDLQSTLEARNARIERLNEQIEELPEPETVANLRGQVRELEVELEAAASRVADLELELRARRRTIDGLNRRIRNLREPWMTADERLTEKIDTDFDSGGSMLGAWNPSGPTLNQTDSTQLFARFAVPAIQANTDLMYTLRAESTDDGWVGYGMHFLADDWSSERGYGFGRSYLVWLTRDERAMRNQRTYVQLYRSYDDVRMELLASVAVEEDIADPIDTSVYVDRSANEISVLVNERHVFSFLDEAIIRGGRVVAMRALGTVRFHDLEVVSE